MTPAVAISSIRLRTEENVPSRLLKKPHMLRCARPTRFNVLKSTPQLIELRAPCL
jgi:hypothetical protein